MSNAKEVKENFKMFMMRVPQDVYDKIAKISEDEKRSKAKQIMLMVEYYIEEKFNKDLTRKCL